MVPVVGVVGVVVAGVVVVFVGAVYCPTMIVTFDPLLAVELAPGDWEMTIPFFFLRFTDWDCCVTVNPAAVNVLEAAAAFWPTTFGTLAVVAAGACATTRVTVDPGVTCVPARGV